MYILTPLEYALYVLIYMYVLYFGGITQIIVIIIYDIN